MFRVRRDLKRTMDDWNARRDGATGCGCSDGYHNETVVASDRNGNLADERGNRYTGAFDGKDVTFTSADGATFRGSWIQGSGETTGIVGGGELSGKFSFIFFDHGDGSQRLNASWTFRGSSEDAVAAWEKAGYVVSPLDNRFNKEHQAPDGGSLIQMRGSGNFLTGADSGHAILVVDPNSAACAGGEVHVGEHNPMVPLGFVLHHAERMTAHRRSQVLGYSSLVLSLFCWVNAPSRISIFDVFSSISARRNVVVMGASLSLGLAFLAGKTGSKWWLLAIVPAVALYGLLGLH